MPQGKENKPIHQASLAPWQTNSKPTTVLDNYLTQSRQPNTKHPKHHHRSFKKHLKHAISTIPTQREHLSDLNRLKKEIVTIDQDCSRWDHQPRGPRSPSNAFRNNRVNSQFLRPTLKPKQLNYNTLPARQPFSQNRPNLKEEQGRRASSPMHRTHGRFIATSEGKRRPRTRCTKPDSSLNICINQLEADRMKRILSWLQHLN